MVDTGVFNVSWTVMLIIVPVAIVLTVLIIISRRRLSKHGSIKGTREHDDEADHDEAATTSRRSTVSSSSSSQRRQHRPQSSAHITTELRRIQGAVTRERAEELQRQKHAAAIEPPEIKRLAHLVDTLHEPNSAEGGCRNNANHARLSSSSCRWDRLIAIGDIYFRGAFPRFLPDEDVAIECYRTAAMCPDGYIAGLGQTKYIEARLSGGIPDEDRAGVPLPESYGLRACAAARTVIQSTPFGAFEKPKQIKKDAEDRREEAEAAAAAAAAAVTTARTTTAEERTRREAGHRQVQETDDVAAFEDIGAAAALFLDDDHDHALQLPTDLTAGAGRRRDGVIEFPLPPQIIRDLQRDPVQQRAPGRRDAETRAFLHDAQNVHDHAVSSVTDHNLRAIRERQEQERERLRQQGESARDEGGRWLEAVKKGVVSCGELSDTEKADALRVLESLSTNQHSTYGVSERDALLSVWNEVQKSEHRDNLIETLAKQLASAQENGHTVCSSGKMARIVSTLDGVSNDATPRPMWAVREEIASLAAKVRDEHEKRGSDDDAAAAKDFAERARQDYVERLGMNAKIVEPIIDEYSAAF